MSDTPIPYNPNAFPTQDSEEFNGQREIYAETGMSLRDYFAAKAMQGLMMQDSVSQCWRNEKIAEWSYKIADEMLRQRLKKVDNQS